MLALVDRGYSSGQLAHSEREAILSVSCQNIKLNGRLPPEELILRLPLMQVASCTYIRDDASHLILVHHCPSQTEGETLPGLEASCLTVMAVECRMTAEEVCALVRQSFQLLYTEATMQFFNRQVGVTPSGSGMKTPVSQTPLESAPPTPTAASPESGLAEGLQEYMAELHKALPASGMSEFANRLRQWKGGQCTFRNFLQNLFRLFSAEGSPALLKGLRPFIPAHDVPVFEDFLREHALHSDHPRAGPTFSRAFSQASSSWSGASIRSQPPADEIERRLNSALAEVNRLEDIVRGRVSLETVSKSLKAGDAQRYGLGSLLMQFKQQK